MARLTALRIPRCMDKQLVKVQRRVLSSIKSRGTDFEELIVEVEVQDWKFNIKQFLKYPSGDVEQVVRR